VNAIRSLKLGDQFKNINGKKQKLKWIYSLINALLFEVSVKLQGFWIKYLKRKFYFSNFQIFWPLSSEKNNRGILFHFSKQLAFLLWFFLGVNSATVVPR